MSGLANVASLSNATVRSPPSVEIRTSRSPAETSVPVTLRDPSTGWAVFTLTFGSNVFVPTRTLPGWLQAWVKINPVSALSDALTTSLGWVYVAVALMALVGALLTIRFPRVP